MVQEDGIAELKRRSVRVAAVRRYSTKNIAHFRRRSAEGGDGGGPPVLPLLAIQGQASPRSRSKSTALSCSANRQAACARLASLKLSGRRTCTACYEVHQKHNARNTKSPWRRSLLFVLDEPRSSAPAFTLYIVRTLYTNTVHPGCSPVHARLQPCAPRLQPHARQAAAPCTPGCSPVHPGCSPVHARLQPHDVPRLQPSRALCISPPRC